MKPLIIAGRGIRLAKEQKRFRQFIERCQVPFVSTWGGADLTPTDHPLNTGILGMCGQIGANKAVQECANLIAVGTHLAIPHTTTLTDKFAPNAKIMCVNIDQDQLANMNVKVTPWCKGVSEWLDSALFFHAERSWIERCLELKKMNEVGRPKVAYGVNSYVFNDIMTRMLPAGTCMVIDGGGTALYTGFQSSHIKEGSRLICSTGMSAMGSGLPEAVGACFASGILTTCLIGDGSFMLNIQELQTIKHHNLPIKIFVINNDGYLAIRDTQKGFLGGRHTGVGGDKDKSISFTPILRQSLAYGIDFVRITSMNSIEEVIGSVLDRDGPCICEVICPGDQEMRWRQGFIEENGKFIPQTLDNMKEAA